MQLTLDDLQTYLPLGYGLLVGTLADVSSGKLSTISSNSLQYESILHKSLHSLLNYSIL